MEKEKQIEYTPGKKYCRRCAYFYNPVTGCDCDINKIIEAVDK